MTIDYDAAIMNESNISEAFCKGEYVWIEFKSHKYLFHLRIHTMRNNNGLELAFDNLGTPVYYNFDSYNEIWRCWTGYPPETKRNENHWNKFRLEIKPEYEYEQDDSWELAYDRMLFRGDE